MRKDNHYLNNKIMDIRQLGAGNLVTTNGKSIKDCHLRKIEVLDKNKNVIKTITESINP